MIYFYSGTPGSGKSYCLARTAKDWICLMCKNVITNVAFDFSQFTRNKRVKYGEVIYKMDNELTVDFFINYSLENLKQGVEHQCLIVFDEAQTIFSPTAIKLKCQEDRLYRKRWLDFFTMHRHLGYDIILVSQFDRLIDAQVRCLFEYNYIHRKLNNYGKFGKIIDLLKISMFNQTIFWYGSREVLQKKIVFFNRKFAKVYNSYAFREVALAKLEEMYPDKYKKKKSLEKKDNKKKIVIVKK